MASAPNRDAEWAKNRGSLQNSLTISDPRTQLEAIHAAEPDTIWIRHDPIYERWKFDPDSRMLWITGPPACGKSVIARHLVEHDLQSESGTLLCHHFFSSDEKGKKNALMEAARSILAQILAADGEPRVLPAFEALWEERPTDLPTPFNPPEPMDRGPPERLAVTCVLDGPDGVFYAPGDFETFGKFLDVMLQGDHGYDFNILITCRPVFAGLEKGPTRSLILRLEAFAPQYAACLERYLDRILPVEREMARNSFAFLDGSFLCANGVVADLDDKHTINGAKWERNTINKYLEAATNIYLAALDRMARQATKQLSLRMLRILVVAARPLTRDELVAAACLDEEEVPGANLVIESRCLGLMTLNDDDEISLTPCFGVRNLVIESFDISVSDLHWKMAKRCMDYISSLAENGTSPMLHVGESSQSASLTSSPLPFLGYATRYWAFHTNRAPLPPEVSPTFNYGVIWENALGADRLPSKDIPEIPQFWRSVLNMCNPMSVKFQTWFPLYWRAAFPSAPLPVNFVQEVAVSDIMVAAYLDLGHAILVSEAWSTTKGEKEHEIQNTRSPSGQTPLHVASLLGHFSATEALVKIRTVVLQLNLRDSLGRTPLHLATKGKHTHVVYYLLRTPEINPNSLDHRGQSPLHYAAKWGDEKITEALIDADAGVDLEDYSNNTPRICAGKVLEDLRLTPYNDGGIFRREFRERMAVYDLLGKAEVAGTTGLSDTLKLRPYEAADDAFEMEAVAFTARESGRKSFRFTVKQFLGREVGKRFLRENRGDFLWLHLPVNNMNWVEVLLKQFEPDVFDSGARDEILCKEAWANCLHQGSIGYLHATFMKPQCGLVTVGRQRQSVIRGNQVDFPEEDCFEDNQDQPAKSVLFLYMPYIHWEEEQAVVEMSKLLENVRQLQVEWYTPGLMPGLKDRIAHLQAHHVLEKYKHLMDDYWGIESPVHHRRTLDQYRYYNLRDTSERDTDQVFGRVLSRSSSIKPVLMVDQLWLWCLPDGTIITTFPGRWGWDETCPGMLDKYQGKTNVLQNVKRQLRHIDGPDKMIPTTVAECLKACFEATLYRSRSSLHHSHETFPNILETYSKEIGKITNEEAILFKRFTENVKTLKDSTPRKTAVNIVDPVEEMGLLREIKDIVDELQTMDEIFADQLKVLRQAIENLLPEQRLLDQEKQATSSAEWNELCRLVNSRRDEVAKMMQQGMANSQALNDLIDLKQKFSNVLEARWARTMAEDASRQAEETARQGTTLMVFTSVTIIFLPLSFMAAFFALNIAQFPKTEDDELDLGFVSQYIFAISAVVVVPLLLLAFNFNRLSYFNELAKASILDSMDLAQKGDAWRHRPKNHLRTLRGEVTDDSIHSNTSKDGLNKDGTEDKDDLKPSLPFASLLFWAFVVVPVHEVRFGCVALLKATRKLHIMDPNLGLGDSSVEKSPGGPSHATGRPHAGAESEPHHTTTSNNSRDYRSSEDPDEEPPTSPELRPQIRQALSVGTALVRLCFIPIWLSILGIDLFVGGVGYFVLSLVLHPNPLAGPVKKFFGSTLFSLEVNEPGEIRVYA